MVARVNTVAFEGIEVRPVDVEVQISGGLLRERPFRAPHHSASLPALVGGGHRVKPGEISLAHNGVLFLDELPEFQRATLESLRQPLETGEALIARVNSHVTFPARFQLVAAMNPCRCGTDYQGKISGPVMDRIDVITDVPAVSVHDISSNQTAESSASVAARIRTARAIQEDRLRAHGSDALVNAHADGKILESIAPLELDARELLNKSMAISKLSARGYFRVLRVARTIADLNGAPEAVRKIDIAEALSYRRQILS